MEDKPLSSIKECQQNSWDGSAWTNTNDLNQAKAGLRAGSGAEVHINIRFGGFAGKPGYHSSNTESWDGSSLDCRFG